MRSLQDVARLRFARLIRHHTGRHRRRLGAALLLLLFPQPAELASTWWQNVPIPITLHKLARVGTGGCISWTLARSVAVVRRRKRGDTPPTASATWLHAGTTVAAFAAIAAIAAITAIATTL